jgi:hypothetical protein
MGTYTAKCDICFAENQVPNYGDWTCSQCRQPYDYDEGHRIHLTDAQMDDLRNPPRWITVSERLPELQQNVLAAVAGEVGIAHRYVDGWFWDVNEWSRPFTPTHWMPLPEPPAQ